MTEQDVFGQDSRVIGRYMKMKPHSAETVLLLKAMEIADRTNEPTDMWVVKLAHKILEDIL